MKEKLVDFLKQFKEKRQLIFFFTLFSFLIGFSETILFSIPVSRFLDNYSSDYLPIVYMLLGLMMLLLGIFFSYIQKKCSFFTSLMLPMSFFSLLQVFYWQSLKSNNSVLTFFSFSGSVLIVFFSLSFFLILCYRLFTTNELKIFSGLFFGISSIGGVTAGLVMPYLLLVISSYDVVLLSGLSTGSSCLLLFLIKKNNPQRFIENSSIAIPLDFGAINQSIETKKYIYKVFVTTLITFLIYYLIDFNFNSEVQRNYPNETERTIFYGYFNAIIAGLSLIFSFILYPLLYLKFGQKGAFLSFPLLMLVLAVIGFFLNALTSNMIVIFYFVVVLQLLMISFVESTVLSSRFQFFQPLKVSIRAWAQFKSEMVVIPLSISFAGFFLYLVDKFFGFIPSVLFLFLIIFSAAMAIIYLFFLEKKYIQLLVASISKNIYKMDRFTKIGKDEIKLLEKKLFSEIPSEVTYSLNMLEKNDPKDFDLRLRQVIHHKNASIQLYCLKKIFDKHVVSLKKDVESILLKDKNPLIVSGALLSYGSLLESFNDLEKCLDEIISPHPDVVASKLSSCLLYGTALVKEKAVKKLKDLVFSSNENDQLIAAKVLQNYKHKDYLLKLLSGSSINVKKNACTKCLILDEDIVEVLLDNITIPELKTEVTSTLLINPDLTLKVAKARFFSQKLPMQKSIITLISLLKIPQAQQFLKDLVPISNRATLKRLLKTLKATNQDHLDIDFEFLLDREMKNVLYLIEIINCFGIPSTEVMFCLLAREIEIGKRICYLILSFIYPEISFSTVDTVLLKKNEDFESNLEEVLLIKVNLESRHQLKQMLLFFPEKGQGSSYDIKKKLLEVLNYGANAFIPSLRSAAIYTLGLMGFKDCQSVIEEQAEDLDFLIPEFKLIALKLLQK